MLVQNGVFTDFFLTFDKITMGLLGIPCFLKGFSRHRFNHEDQSICLLELVELKEPLPRRRPPSRPIDKT